MTYQMWLLVGILTILLLFGFVIKGVSMYEIKKSNSLEPDGYLKEDFCKEYGYKYYKGACWQGYIESVGVNPCYRYPVNTNSGGSFYLGQKEKLGAYYCPSGI